MQGGIGRQAGGQANFPAGDFDQVGGFVPPEPGLPLRFAGGQKFRGRLEAGAYFFFHGLPQNPGRFPRGDGRDFLPARRFMGEPSGLYGEHRLLHLPPGKQPGTFEKGEGACCVGVTASEIEQQILYGKDRSGLDPAEVVRSGRGR